MSTPAPTRVGAGLGLVTTAGVLWGTGGLAVDVIHDRSGMGAGTISAYRMALGAAALLLVVLLTRQHRALVALVRNRGSRVVAVGVATAAYQGLYFSAVLHVGVGVATVVSLGLAPAMVTATACLRERRAPTAAELIALLAAAVGLVLISILGAHGAGGDRPMLGIALAIAAAAGYAATTVVGGDLSREAPALCLASAATAIGAVILVPWALVEVGRGAPALDLDPITVGWLLWLGLATMALAYACLYAGLRTTSSSTATIATLSEPIAAALLAAIFLSERLGIGGLLGGALILAAIVIQVRSGPPAPPVSGTGLPPQDGERR